MRCPSNPESLEKKNGLGHEFFFLFWLTDEQLELFTEWADLFSEAVFTRWSERNSFGLMVCLAVVRMKGAQAQKNTTRTKRTSQPCTRQRQQQPHCVGSYVLIRSEDSHRHTGRVWGDGQNDLLDNQ